MKRKYLSPSVEVIKVAIEKGFATSTRDRYGWDGQAGNDFTNGENYDDL